MLPELAWAVVEQPAFVTAGKREFETEVLHFFDDLEEAVRVTTPNTILVSGVLQYLPDPYALLESLLTQPVEFLVLDRTPFIDSERDRLTVQRVPKHINAASYPAWFFSRARFHSILDRDFDLIEKFSSTDRATFSAEYEGGLWRRRTASDHHE